MKLSIVMLGMQSTASKSNKKAFSVVQAMYINFAPKENQKVWSCLQRMHRKVFVHGQSVFSKLFSTSDSEKTTCSLWLCAKV